MFANIKKAVLSIPILGETLAFVKRQLFDEVAWLLRKHSILRKAEKIIGSGLTIDVSRRYGYFIFHNKGNTLINRGNYYEPDVQQALHFLIILDRLRGNKTVYADIGANIGLHVFYLKSLFSNLDIVAFDPSQYSWKYMELSISYNNIIGVKVEKYALSSRTGMADFYVWGENSSGDSLRNTGRLIGTPTVVSVETKRIDDLKYREKLTVMKLDCEGAELDILKGSIRTLKTVRPMILCEFHIINRKSFAVEIDDIFSFLHKMQYCLLNLKFELLSNEDFLLSQENYEENYILLPNEIVSSERDNISAKFKLCF